jgi:chromosome segregation ATPase
MTTEKPTREVALVLLDKARAEFERQKAPVDKLKNDQVRIGKELGELEDERQELAVRAVSGDSVARARAATILSLRSELLGELEMLETAIPEVQKQVDAAGDKYHEAQVLVFDIEMEIKAMRMQVTANAVDTVLRSLTDTVSQFNSAINELEAMALNTTAHHKSLILEVTHRVRGADLLPSAAAKISGFPVYIGNAGHISPGEIKSLEQSVRELSASMFRN